MKFKHRLVALSVGILLCDAAVPALPTYAASYSISEASQASHFQTEFHKLDQNTNYNQSSLFITSPSFANPFNPGILKPSYITTSMAYVNYYRSLFGLPSEANHKIDNDNAQLGAASLAAVNAKTSLRAHGLIGYKRPSYISEQSWSAAELATQGNINFLETNSGATAGEVVTDLLQDRDNIAGSGNTGHRALILSARATRMGIGAAYGKNNGKLYSVENGMFADDILRRPVKSVVTYPSNSVFPYELVDSNTPWTVYFAGKHVSRIPKVYITDLTTKKKYAAKHVRNFGNDYYGMGYTSAISFKPDYRLKIVNTHKYCVEIKGIYSYTFRLFRQNATTISTINHSHSNKKIVKTKKNHR